MAGIEDLEGGEPLVRADQTEGERNLQELASRLLAGDRRAGRAPPAQDTPEAAIEGLIANLTCNLDHLRDHPDYAQLLEMQRQLATSARQFITNLENIEVPAFLQGPSAGSIYDLVSVRTTIAGPTLELDDPDSEETRNNILRRLGDTVHRVTDHLT